MARVLILGATGSLGLHLLRQALADGHDVTVFVRTPSKLPPEVRGRVSIHAGDLNVLVPLDLVKGEDALINCAGHAGDGERFVALIDRLVAGVDSLSVANQRVCWFLAGAALFDLDSAGRRGVDLPPAESGLAPSLSRARSFCPSVWPTIASGVRCPSACGDGSRSDRLESIPQQRLSGDFCDQKSNCAPVLNRRASMIPSGCNQRGRFWQF